VLRVVAFQVDLNRFNVNSDAFRAMVIILHLCFS